MIRGQPGRSARIDSKIWLMEELSVVMMDDCLRVNQMEVEQRGQCRDSRMEVEKRGQHRARVRVTSLNVL